MKQFFDWSEAANPERNEIVFENRHKDYGAYDIRKKYFYHVALALLVAFISAALAAGIPVLVSYFSKVILEKEIKLTEGIKLEEPPPIDKTAPPPPPVIPPPPVQQTIKFTPPKVVKDEVIEEPPPTQEEVKDIQVSTITQEGDVEIIDLPPDPIVDPDEGKIFTVVEEMPTFPGGEGKLFELLSRIEYPIIARENGISGYVSLTFIVDKDGKVKDAAVLRGIGGGCDEEALRIVRALPDWNPGRQNGRAVPVRTNVRINFQLQ
jgi:protein TonB